MSYVRPGDMYWAIAGDMSRIWSSAHATFVTSTDERYLAWAKENVSPLRADSDEQLAEYLHGFGLPGPIVKPAWVVEERERRLAAGFDYDFEDERGVHWISTTEQDMVGWEEITTGATAAVLVGLPSTPFDIVTNTGPVRVTAAEWQQILLAATRFRQPIWLKSFALQAMDPIPVRFRDDEYWS